MPDIMLSIILSILTAGKAGFAQCREADG